MCPLLFFNRHRDSELKGVVFFLARFFLLSYMCKLLVLSRVTALLCRLSFLEPVILLPQPQSAELTGVCRHAQLCVSASVGICFPWPEHEYTPMFTGHWTDSLRSWLFPYSLPL